MCRSIKVLRRAGEPATAEEVRAAALQYVRKISGFHKPSRANSEAFERALDEIAGSSARLLETLGVKLGGGACEAGPVHDEPGSIHVPSAQR